MRGTPLRPTRRLAVWLARCHDPILYDLGQPPEQRVGLAGAPCGCPPVGANESPPCQALSCTHGPKRSEACSNGNQKSIKCLFGNRQVILLQNRNVDPNSITYLAYRFFAGLPLAHATRQAQAFGHPLPVFALENHRLSHLHYHSPRLRRDHSAALRIWINWSAVNGAVPLSVRRMGSKTGYILRYLAAIGTCEFRSRPPKVDLKVPNFSTMNHAI